MAYDAPGHADALDDDLRRRWNGSIGQLYDALGPLPTRFFSLDPGALGDGATAYDGITWPADPREPGHVSDQTTVRKLCDWGRRGRHDLQNEYCEWAVIHRPGSDGRVRPKRVQMTTELREYWLCLAVHGPETLRAAACEVLGREISWRELYGPGVLDPLSLSQEDRRIFFALEMAGNGGFDDMIRAGVPANPRGRLNTQTAMFMTQPINGLDDLLYMVAFGARRFAVRGADRSLRRATIDDIFTGSRAALACRHADPAAALGAYEAVLDGRQLAFANPLGVYFGDLDRERLRYDGEAIPAEWVRVSRGGQRLVLGPENEDDAFLDDILQIDPVNGREEPLTGGYQLARALRVGPRMLVAPTEPASADEYDIRAPGFAHDCRNTPMRRRVEQLLVDYERDLTFKPGPRQPPD